MFEEEYLHISEDSPIMSGSEEIKSSSSKKSLNIKYLTKKIDTNLVSGSKPKFLKLFESIKIEENSALLLSCQVVGDPKPELYW